MIVLCTHIRIYVPYFTPGNNKKFLENFLDCDCVRYCTSHFKEHCFLKTLFSNNNISLSQSIHYEKIIIEVLEDAHLT